MKLLFRWNIYYIYISENTYATHASNGDKINFIVAIIMTESGRISLAPAARDTVSAYLYAIVVFPLNDLFVHQTAQKLIGYVQKVRQPHPFVRECTVERSGLYNMHTLIS